jgi:cysteine synthase A
MRSRRCWDARWGRRPGTNFIGMLAVAEEMRAAGRQGSILSLLCDSGERYLPSYHDAAWVKNAFGDIGPAQQRIDALVAG